MFSGTAQASLFVLSLVLLCVAGGQEVTKGGPRLLAISTWNFGNATEKAFETLKAGWTAVDAVEKGCSVCEELQCDFTVGFGGSPAENGETALDAMIMDGVTGNVGAVANLRRVKSAISVARKVLDHTRHSILVGDLATQFAVQMGFKEETLQTDMSKEKWIHWKDNHCQPNFWLGVQPDPTTSCGPYSSNEDVLDDEAFSQDDETDEVAFDYGGPGNHDTIGMITIDYLGNIACGTSSNGATFKIPGRVGDSPIPGAGSYADNDVGAAAATGDGDVMLRFLPSFLAVEMMRSGKNPQDAATLAIERIVSKYPSFSGALIAVNRDGEYGAACHRMDTFPFTVATEDSNKVETVEVKCV